MKTASEEDIDAPGSRRPVRRSRLHARNNTTTAMNTGFGEAYFAINGDIVSHASISDDEDEADEPIVVSWLPTDLSYSAEVISELLQKEVAATMINGMVPREFKCSRFGRKVLKSPHGSSSGFLVD